MPLALTTDDRFELTLETDKDKDEATRPAFVFRYLSGREQKALAVALGAIENVPSGLAGIEAWFTALRVAGLVDWRNCGQPFDDDALEDVLRFAEAEELAYGALAHRPDRGDLKNSPSPSDSPADGSDAAASATGPAATATES